MKKPPGLGLRIALVKVSEKGRVRQVLQARGSVSHDIGGSVDEEPGVTVAVLALVGALVVAEQGSGSFTGYSAFREPSECRRVVRTVADGGVGDVVRQGH